MQSEYYDYDAWLRRQHDDENESCMCADCKERAENIAADLYFDMWYEESRLGNI